MSKLDNQPTTEYSFQVECGELHSLPRDRVDSNTSSGSSSYRKIHLCPQTVVSTHSSFDGEQNVAPIDGHHEHPHVALLCPITNGKTITFPLDSR